MLPKINCEEKRKFFDTFYGSGSWDVQTSIIYGSVKNVPIKRKRSKTDKKKFSRNYYIPSADGNDMKVCKKTYLKILQISGSTMHQAIAKAKTSSLCDQRRKHVPHNKSADSAIIHILNHISSFPSTSSHYCRRDSSKKYFDSRLDLSLMYRLFIDKLKEEDPNVKPPSQSLYEKVFRRDFNLSFKPPQKDTCQTCDRLNKLITAEETLRAGEADTDKLRRLRKEQELHHRKAEAARDCLKSDMENSKTEDLTVFSFDLQKALLLPKLITGVAYYKHQLSCFNLGIHDFKSGKAVMHCWNESIASRGAEEVGSCVLKYVKSHDIGPRMVVWSDSCGGKTGILKL
ncbi:uncharacterized protein LOC124607309 [Schistocerca americana]|uniref:uncharacterized protein LOC124607309 n=1 Tax=Schistocerca americana TaxID=7009 RepID=UPI001F4F2E81|nr:uncharacterized protein LOC124607309 [Schistocerca americana]